MCLIIRAEGESSIPEALVSSAAARNKDGWGMMFHDGTKMYIRKSLEMKKIMDLLPKLKGHKALIHLRFATHGTVSYNNTHPYKITDDVYFMHNGVMHKFNDPSNKDSDSKVFADTILTPLVSRCGPRVIIEPFFQQIVKEFCGYTNRFAFMNSSGDIVTVGDWSEDPTNKLWLSNTSAYDTKTCDVVSKYTYTNTVGSSGGYGNGYTSNFPKSKWEIEREAREKAFKERKEDSKSGTKTPEPLVKVTGYEDDFFDSQWYAGAKYRQNAIDKAVAKDKDPVSRAIVIPVVNAKSESRESSDKEDHTECSASTGTISADHNAAGTDGKPEETRKEMVETDLVGAAEVTNYLESYNDDDDDEYDDVLERRAHALCDALNDLDISHVSDLRQIDVRDLAILCEFEPDWVANLIHSSYARTHLIS